MTLTATANQKTVTSALTWPITRMPLPSNPNIIHSMPSTLMVMLGPLIQWGSTSGSKVDRTLVCLWLHNVVLKTMALNLTFDTTVCQLEEQNITKSTL